MQQEQLTLFGDDQVVGTGQPHPWPTVAADVEPETAAVDPDQLAFGDEAGEAA